MGEEEVPVTINFYNKDVTVQVDPAMLDALEQEMKVTGITHEEILCFGFSKFFVNHSLEELEDITLDDFGIKFPIKEYDKEMSVSEFLSFNSTDSEIRSKQKDLRHKRKDNLNFMLYINAKARSYHEKRLAWLEKLLAEKQKE